MKKSAILAFAGAMLVSGAALAADYAEVEKSYVRGAFSGADEKWRDQKVIRFQECGSFGSGDTRRIDVLISRYEALGDALDSGNEEAITTASRSFASAVNANSRFEECWDSISRGEGIRLKFKKSVAKV